MEFFGFIIAIVVVIWALRIEQNTAQIAKSLQRIENQLVAPKSKQEKK